MKVKLTNAQMAILGVGALAVGGGYAFIHKAWPFDSHGPVAHLANVFAATTTGGVGPDGIKELYATLPGTTPFYLGNAPDKTKFNVSYGTNSHIAFSGPKTEGGMVYYNTTGNPITYHSGAAPGRSVRLDVYPGGGMWANKTAYSWKSNPGYLYTPAGIASGEYTIYLRPHGSLGTHQSCAWKLGGRDEDAIRSLFEICAADGQHSAPHSNWNYAHFPYVSAPTTVYPHGKLTAEQWYGVKAVRIVDPSKKFCDFYLYEDTVVGGKPANTWKMIGHAHDAGTSGYGNIPCTWKSHKDLMRVDGFQSVDFAYMSTRSIAVAGATTTAASPVTPISPRPITSPVAQLAAAVAGTGTGAKDPFGITKLYPDANPPKYSGTTGGGGIEVHKMASTGKTVPRREWEIRGPAFLNQEVTIYFNLAIKNPDTMSMKLRGGPHSSNQCACNYIHYIPVNGDTHIIGGQCPHLNYHSGGNALFALPNMTNKWVGAKAVEWNQGSGVRMQTWIDLTGTPPGTWQKWVDVVDTGQFGFAPMTKSPWSCPTAEILFRTDFEQGGDCQAKFISAREITPSAGPASAPSAPAVAPKPISPVPITTPVLPAPAAAHYSERVYTIPNRQRGYENLNRIRLSSY